MTATATLVGSAPVVIEIAAWLEIYVTQAAISLMDFPSGVTTRMQADRATVISREGQVVTLVPVLP